jgi:hypothetical protein
LPAEFRQLGSFRAIPKTGDIRKKATVIADWNWQVLHGYRVLRHSFISVLAIEGVDQRMIDGIGHQADGQRKRFGHFYSGVIKKRRSRVAPELTTTAVSYR